jgi:geranylgeranyl transferase type-1 subunit beta
MAAENRATFDKARHTKYWKRNADLLPEPYTSGDAGRMSMGFFVVAALDLLGVLETVISEPDRKSWIDWIYSLQITTGGFRGFPGTDLRDRRNKDNSQWDPANLHTSFMALTSLLVLGDDLRRVRRKECLAWIERLQRPNGCFGEMLGEDDTVLGKDDTRSTYCATGIIYILSSTPPTWLDRDRIVRYIANCQDTEGAFGQSWLREAHAGLNFCAVATLGCLDQIFGTAATTRSVFDSPLLQLEDNITWMLQRQTTWIDDSDTDEELEDEEGQAAVVTAIAAGFSGRCNKMADTCYCFWNAGALALLGRDDLIDTTSMKQYLFASTQHMIGGFSKVPGAVPDLLHAYTGLAALAIVGQDGLQGLDPVLAVSVRTRSRLQQLKQTILQS